MRQGFSTIANIQIKKHNKLVTEGKIPGATISRVLCPGLGITSGCLSPLTSAIQMMHAFKVDRFLLLFTMKVIAFGYPASNDAIGHRRLALQRRLGEEEALRSKLQDLRSLRNSNTPVASPNEDNCSGHPHQDHNHQHHSHARHACRGMVR